MNPIRRGNGNYGPTRAEIAAWNKRNMQAFLTQKCRQPRSK
jgi:hypothetical protein